MIHSRASVVPLILEYSCKDISAFLARRVRVRSRYDVGNMEGSPCAHEQQNRHLKSRVSQLEIMLEKERKRTSATSQPTMNHNWIPRDVPPVDVKKSQEYISLLADLESERRVKRDLMANLKEMQISNDSSRALLLQELEEVKTSRDSLSAELEELQDEFDAIRGMFKSQLMNTTTDDRENTEGAGTAAIDCTTSGSFDGRLTVSSLRALVSCIDRFREQTIHSLLLSIARQFPLGVIGDQEQEEYSQISHNIRQCISTMSDMKISRHNMEGLRCLIESCGKSSIPETADDIAALAADLGMKRIHELEMRTGHLRSTIYKLVPSIFEDLFVLLSKSTSFHYPSESEVFDDAANLAYGTYLKTTSTTLSHTIRKYITSHAKSRQKLSYRAFSAGELALFLPTRNVNSPAWAAFNVGAPHYFLDMDGVDTQGKDFLIGRIQEITEMDGEPGLNTPTAIEASTAEIRKWWEVKILEKKKVMSSAGR